MKLGRKLGSGKGREVFAHPTDPTLVIKVLRKPSQGLNPNEIEWLVWQTVKGTEYEQHFCPCVGLTEEGHLLMARCTKGSWRSKKLHLNGVSIKDSRKSANMGKLDDRQVLIDYGNRSALEFAKSLP